MAQMFLSDAVQNKDQTIQKLNDKVFSLNSSLTSEKERLIQIQNSLNLLTKKYQIEHENLEHLEEDHKTVLNHLEETRKILAQEVLQNENDQKEITTLSQLIQTLEEKLSQLQKNNAELEEENIDYKNKNRVTSYRSEFFEKLKEAVGDLEGIKIVGDRFIFQSELLFDVASADLGDSGKKQLRSICLTLKEISKKIPDDIHWILRVDGHTDKRPIKSTFPSNWELSSARAIAVVKFLIQEGISPKNLVAAGFGEHQPLVTADESDDALLARNRRIEFKLDQR